MSEPPRLSRRRRRRRAGVAHRVRPGESLSAILRDHALTVDALTLARVRQINPEITDLDLVRVGQGHPVARAAP
ncbi:MAG: hypothetical protein WDO24_23695 [Pseudomonadota bacterium]